MMPLESSPRLQPLLDDHAQLRQFIRSLRDDLGRRRAQPHDMAASLENLQEMMRKHFAEEEASGFFQIVLDRWPQAGMRVERLTSQHCEFLDEIAACMSLALRGDSSAAWWTELERHFDELADRYDQHEQEENALLIDVYDSDLGTKD